MGIKLFGRWPWDRGYHAALLDALKTSGAKTIAFDILFTEVSNKNSDDLLVKTVSDSGNVIMAAIFYEINLNLGNIMNTPYSDKYYADKKNFSDLNIINVRDALLPFNRLLEVTSGIGSVSTFADENSLYEWYPLMVRYDSKVFPSLPLAAVCNYLNVSIKDLTVSKSRKGFILNLGDKKIPINENGQVKLDLPDKGMGFEMYSYSSVILMADTQKEKLKETFNGKLVLIGIYASAVQDSVATKKSLYYPGVQLLAAVVEMLLESK